MSTEHLPPSSLPPVVTDLLAAIGEALDVPLPSTEVHDERAASRLLDRRATYVRHYLESLRSHPDVSLHRDAADLRRHIADTPVTYTTWETQKQESQQAAAVESPVAVTG
ncbi:hypothetical protein [Streptomyces sp. NPDC058108]|uniref:hypothetical protein n=1 Tax=Streptomyces sp. NPDC058108 TaxID=3346344 RepID=UPI0036E2AD60